MIFFILAQTIAFSKTAAGGETVGAIIGRINQLTHREKMPANSTALDTSTNADAQKKADKLKATLPEVNLTGADIEDKIIAEQRRLIEHAGL